jgi:hypothetical protein
MKRTVAAKSQFSVVQPYFVPQSGPMAANWTVLPLVL